LRLLASISGSIPLWESEESPAPVIALVLGANLGGALSDGLRGMGWMHRVREHQAWSTIVTSNLPFEEWTSVFQSQRPPRSPSFSRKPPLGAKRRNKPELAPLQP
jgi:hypothetical protein